MNILPLSKSRFSVFERCAFYCSMVYERKIRPPRGKAGSVGVLLHGLKHDVQTGKTALEDALSVIKAKDDKDALTYAIESDDLIGKADRIEWEWDLRINAKGLPVKRRGVLRGILDCALWLQPQFIVQDIKFGRWWYDDPFERRSYVLLTLPHIEPDQDVVFQRVWPKLGRVDSWLYVRTGSFYRVEENGDPIDLWDYIQQCVLLTTTATPTPTPGDHCENWFGEPCYFLNNFCPLSKDLPVPVSSEAGAIKGDIHRILNDDVMSLSPTVVASAFSGALQLQGLVAVILNKVKEWSAENGNISLGSTTYGWKERRQNSVDKEFVLKLLLDNNVSIEDIAKAVNISYTSLKGLPKGPVKDFALQLGVTEHEPIRDFGKIIQPT